MRIALVSNGHGEDVIAASVGQALIELGGEPVAVPVVGDGRAYEEVGIGVRGPRRSFPSGGYTVRSGGAFMADLRAGLVPALLEVCRAIRRETASADACLIVGDRFALCLASATVAGGRYFLPSAVSVMAWPPDAMPWQAPFGPMERALMRRCRAVYPRDAASTDWLRARGVGNVHDLGNPMLDACYGDAEVEPGGPYLLLLPGTREDRWFSLPRMVEAARMLRGLGLAAVAAWTGAAEPPSLAGWERSATGRARGVTHRYLHPDGAVVWVSRGAFATLVPRTAAVLSTSGTAAEQCAGHGLPVVAFPTGGPQYTPQFAAGQKRALGDALEVVASEPRAIAAAVRDILSDPARLARARRDGARAMGRPGAAVRIARHLWAGGAGERQSIPEAI